MRTIQWPETKDFQCWNKLRILRKTLNLTLVDVAAGVGVSINTISICEKGFEDMVSEDIKHRIAKYFDCKFEDLFPAERVGSKPAPPHSKKAAGPKLVNVQFFR